MQQIHIGNVNEFEAIRAKKAALNSDEKLSREQMVEFLMINEGVTKEDLLRDFAWASNEARRRARHRRAA